MPGRIGLAVAGQGSSADGTFEVPSAFVNGSGASDYFLATAWQPTPMVFHPVSRAVNRNEFEDPTAIEAIALPAPEPARPVQASLFGPGA